MEGIFLELTTFVIFIADENALWKFSVRGCFKTKSEKQECSIKIQNLDKTPPSLLEITLRTVYETCFEPQVKRTNINETVSLFQSSRAIAVKSKVSIYILIFEDAVFI